MVFITIEGPVRVAGGAVRQRGARATCAAPAPLPGRGGRTKSAGGERLQADIPLPKPVAGNDLAGPQSLYSRTALTFIATVTMIVF